MPADDRLRQRRVHPGVGPRVEGVVADAVRPHALDPPCISRTRRPDLPGEVGSPVDHRAGVVERAQQPAPRVLLEVGVLAHPRPHRGVAHLQEQRVAGGGEEAGVARDPPGDPAARRDQLGRLPPRRQCLLCRSDGPLSIAPGSAVLRRRPGRRRRSGRARGRASPASSRPRRRAAGGRRTRRGRRSSCRAAARSSRDRPACRRAPRASPCASRREPLHLLLAAALDPVGDRGVAASLAQEDQPVDVGRIADRPQEAGEALGQGGLGIGEVGVREGALDLGQDPLLLAGEQRPEELVLAGEAGVDDRLGHARLVGDRLHRGAVVAVLEEELERRVENLGPAPLGAEVGGALAVARLGGVLGGQPLVLDRAPLPP